MPRRLTTIAVASAIGLSALSVTFVAVPALAGDTPSGGPVAAIRDRLQGLVDDETITDAQADKVAETLGERGGPGFGRGGHGLFDLSAVAGVLGMSEDDVRSSLRDGKTLADLAEEKDKSTDDVAAALTTSATEHIDQAVEDGRLTSEQAAEAKSRLADGVKRFVEEGFPGKGRGFGGGHGPWGGGRDGERPGSPSTPPTPSTPSTPSPSATATNSSFSA